MRTLKKQIKVSSGIFISKEMLSRAKIDTEDILLEINDYEVRIRALKNNNKTKTITANSPLWKCIGFAQIEDVNGRDHDQYLYDEK